MRASLPAAVLAAATLSSGPGRTEPPPAASPTCQISAAEREASLGLPFQTFDQTREGWRKLAAADCHAAAADLLGGYAEKNKLDDRQTSLLRFHEFQMRALSADATRALRALVEVERHDVARKADVGWIAYVAASRAFIARDRDGLDTAAADLERRANSLTPPADRPHRLNLNVVRAFQRCWNEPYRVAYSSPCLDVAEARRINAAER